MRLLALLLLLAVLWLPIAAPIALLVKDPNLVTILTMSLLFGEFLILIQLWGRWVYQDPRILQTYGLDLSRQNAIELLQGLGLGLASLLLLFLVEAALGWLNWLPASAALPRIFLEGMVVGLGVGLAEELVFRGWVLDELQRDYMPGTALWADSLIFACLHFLKPLPEVMHTLPQFLGLVLLGLGLVWARRSTRSRQWSTRSVSVHQGRLGLPMGVHGGLVWGYYILNVGQLIRYSDRVPDWVTGVNHNPLAGVIGLLFLGGLAAYLRQRARRRVLH